MNISSNVVTFYLLTYVNCLTLFLIQVVFQMWWSEGIVIPLFKKGDRNNVANYRGITLLSCLSKLFTTVINKRISSYCDRYNTVSDAQFGFRKGSSTTDATFALLFSII